MRPSARIAGTMFVLAMSLSSGHGQGTMSQDVKLRGLTHEWKDGNLYSALPDVKILVTRNGSVVHSATSKLNNDREAEFDLSVRSGEPIQVVFYLSKDYVPEMQSLSAKAGLRHQLSAALVAVQQYQKMQSANPAVVPLKEKLRCIQRIVPKDSDLYNELLKMLNQK